MSIERIAELVRADPPAERRIRLLYDGGVYLTPVIIGALMTGSVPFLLSLAFAPRVIHHLFYVGTIYTPSFEERPWQAAVIAGVLGFIGTLAWRYLQQGPVEVILDEDGITETEWGRPRLTIPWRDARAFHEVKHRKNRYGQLFELVWVRFAAPSGEMITFSNVDRGLLVPTFPRRVIARRGLGTAVRIARELPSLDPKARDPRVRRALGHPVLRIVRVLGVGLVWFVIIGMTGKYGNNGPLRGVSHAFGPAQAAIGMAALFVGSALAFLIALIRWLRFRKGARVVMPSAGAYRTMEARVDDETVPYERIRVYVPLAIYGFAVIAFTLLPWLWRFEHQAVCDEETKSAGGYPQCP